MTALFATVTATLNLPRTTLERLGATFQSPSGADGAADTSTYVEETFRFLNAPPLWVLALIVLLSLIHI